MASVFDKVEMGEPVARPADAEPVPPLPPIQDVRNAVADFFKEDPDVRVVKVAKVALMDAKEGVWEAEVEVYVPNETIKALGLPLEKEVLDRREHIVRLDRDLKVTAYGLRDLVEERTA